MENRLAELERELGGGLKAAVEEVKAFREKQARYRLHIERRLLRVEDRMKGLAVSPQVSMEPVATKRPYVPRRQYPQLVTEDAEADEERVYGDATPMIVEWRKARDAYHRAAKTSTEVEIRETQERMLWLEIAIIEKYELTLPPEKSPLDEEWRRDAVRQRRRTISWGREERKKALLRRWVRRILTFGIWRN